MDRIKVSLCNEALMLISKSRIQRLDEHTAEARACSEAFDRVFLELLRMDRWNFARKVVPLALLRADESGFVYQLPEDCVFALSLRETDGLILGGESPEFQVRGNEVYALYPQARLEYVSSNVRLDLLDPLFRSALTSRMAAEIAKELTGETQLVSLHYDLFRQYLADAKQRNAQEGFYGRRRANPYVDCR